MTNKVVKCIIKMQLIKLTNHLIIRRVNKYETAIMENKNHNCHREIKHIIKDLIN